MKLNLHGILGFFAVVVIFNLVAGNVLPVLAYAATVDQAPVITDSATDEIPVSAPQVQPTPVRLDINLITLQSNTICGIGNAVANDGLELKVQHWDSSYTLQARYFFSGGSFGDWINIVQNNTALLPNTQFTINPSDATYTAMNVNNSPAGSAGVEFRALDSQSNPLTLDPASTPTMNFTVVNDVNAIVCGGQPVVTHYTVSGHKFANSSDGGTPLQGWVINLYNSNWGYLHTDVTDGNGAYSFDVTATGTYMLCEQNQSGWDQIFPNSNANGISDGSNNANEAPYCLQETIPAETELRTFSGNDFVNKQEEVKVATINVSKNVIDQNRADIFDSTNFQVTLYKNNVRVDGSEETINDSQVNPAVATYSVEPGQTYKVVETAQNGYQILGCFPVDSTSDSFTASADQTINVECTNMQEPTTYTITGTKYEDVNADLKKTEVDTPVSGWRFRLYTQNEDGWTKVSETTTNENGLYTFAELNAGTYFVCEVSQDTWVNIILNSENLVVNASPNYKSEGPECYKVVFNADSDFTSANNDFLNLHLSDLILVSKDVLGRKGEDVTSSQKFQINLYSNNVIVPNSTKTISDDPQSPDFAFYKVTPGTYQINELAVNGFTNLGCVGTSFSPTETTSEGNKNIVIHEGDIARVQCTNQMVNSIPTVNITPTPSQVVTTPTGIVLTANAALGDGTLTYAWTCDTGETGTAQTLSLNTVGTHNCSVTVKDVDADTAIAAGTFYVNAQTVNPPENNQNGNNNGGTGNGGTTTPSDTTTTTPSTDTGLSTTTTPAQNNVLGTQSQTCDSKSTVSGYVFVDKNANNQKDSDEDGVANVNVTLLVNQTNENGTIQEVELRTLKTNTLGRWETTLCPGDYRIRINTQDLPTEDLLGGGDTFSFSVNKGEDKDNVNFAVYQLQTNINTNWWIFLIPILILILAAGGYAIYSTNQRKKNA